MDDRGAEQNSHELLMAIRSKLVDEDFHHLTRRGILSHNHNRRNESKSHREAERDENDRGSKIHGQIKEQKNPRITKKIGLEKREFRRLRLKVTKDRCRDERELNREIDDNESALEDEKNEYNCNKWDI
jgi:hypothetical protein